MRGKKEKGKKMNKKKSSKQSLTMTYSSDYNQTAPRQGWTPSPLVSAKAFRLDSSPLRRGSTKKKIILLVFRMKTSVDLLPITYLFCFAF